MLLFKKKTLLNCYIKEKKKKSLSKRLNQREEKKVCLPLKPGERFWAVTKQYLSTRLEILTVTKTE